MKTTNTLRATALAASLALLVPAAQAQTADPGADRTATTAAAIDNDDDGFDWGLLGLLGLLGLIPKKQHRDTVVHHTPPPRT